MKSNVVSLPGAKSKAKVPSAPSHIVGVGRSEWARVAAVLAERGDLGPETLGTLEMYALQFARWRDAEEHVAIDGPVASAPNTGTPMYSVWFTVANRYSEICLKLAKALKITPDTRTAGASKNAVDPWDDLL